ncbi:hypothetical protein K3495_g3135 [Podosphaera aphanis]|nr:hypothetical protein K3495_g3135 [Podosphaera aphanis]
MAGCIQSLSSSRYNGEPMESGGGISGANGGARKTSPNTAEEIQASSKGRQFRSESAQEIVSGSSD